MMSDRPYTTLFMLTSVDGKISTGSADALDIDQDFPNIKGVSEGLPQYYALEQQTDLHALNSGRVWAKIGINEFQDRLKKTPVSFILIDNKPHLTKRGIENCIQKSQKFYLVTTNKDHPVFQFQENENVEILFYDKKIDFKKLFRTLKTDHGIESMTIQSGGTLNAVFFNQGLIDRISLVIAPAIIGGSSTASLVDGPSNLTIADLGRIKPLQLKSCDTLNNSYVHLHYSVLNNEHDFKERGKFRDSKINPLATDVFKK